MATSGHKVYFPGPLSKFRSQWRANMATFETLVNRFLKASGKRSKENKNLFISISDPTLPIAIHTVRKWVKDTLLSTGVKATPGSTNYQSLDPSGY